MPLKSFIAAAIVAVGFAPSAMAVTVTNLANEGGVPDAWSLVNPAASVTLPGGASQVGFTVNSETANPCGTGFGCSPFDPFKSGDTPLAGWEDIEFFAVGPKGGLTQPATLSFTKKQSSMTFLWGSIDARNSMQFFKNGSLVATVTGLDVPGLEPDKDLSKETGFGASLIKISGIFFDEVKFSSGALNGFEFSNISATAVPLPAAAMLLMSAFAGMGILARGRRTTA